MQDVERSHIRVIVGTTLAMSVLVIGGRMLGVPLWLLAAGVILSLFSLAAVFIAQRPNLSTLRVTPRRLVAMFVVIPLIVGLAGFLSSILGFSPELVAVLAATTFIAGNFIVFRWLD